MSVDVWVAICAMYSSSRTLPITRVPCTGPSLSLDIIGLHEIINNLESILDMPLICPLLLFTKKDERLQAEIVGRGSLSPFFHADEISPTLLCRQC